METEALVAADLQHKSMEAQGHNFLSCGPQIAQASGAILSIVGAFSVSAPDGFRFVALNILILCVAIVGIFLVIALPSKVTPQTFRKVLRGCFFTSAGLALYVAAAFIVHFIDSQRSMPREDGLSLSILFLLGRAWIALFRIQWGWSLILIGSVPALFWYPSILYRAFARREVAKSDGFLSLLVDAPKWPIAGGAILILSGIMVLLTGDHESLANKLAGALISELGFAFFIAYVLGITVEMQSKMEHDRKISRGILSYIYGMELDNRMFFHTEKHIFRSPFFRREATVEYDFFATEGDRILVKQSFSYQVQNISQDQLNYEIRSLVEKPDRTDLAHLMGPNEGYGLNRLYINGTEKSSAEVCRARGSGVAHEDYLVSSYLVPMGPGETVRIKTVNITEKYTIDTELWRSLHPCDGITLKVRWDKGFDLSFYADPVHPAPEFDLLDKDEISLTASVHQPLFPDNGIHFWWRPKSEERRPGASAPPSAESGATPGMGDPSEAKHATQAAEESDDVEPDPDVSLTKDMDPSVR